MIALLGASRMLEHFVNATWGEFGVALLLTLLLPVLAMIALEAIDSPTRADDRHEPF